MNFIPTGFRGEYDSDPLGRAMEMVYLWDLEHARLNKERKAKGISERRWKGMKKKASKDHRPPDHPYLKNLGDLIDKEETR